MSLLSWRPVNFDRWRCLADATSSTTPVQASNLITVIERMRVSWDRLREDLGELFVPSGPPGTHAHHHFHAPPDPGDRDRALNASAADYETFLVYLEIALQLSTQCISGPAGLPMQNWKTLAEAASRGDPGLAADARDQILYLQKTMLYARHKGIVHPRDHISLVSFDNVGNITFWRVAPEPDDTLLAELNSCSTSSGPRSDRTPRSAPTSQSTRPSPGWDRRRALLPTRSGSKRCGTDSDTRCPVRTRWHPPSTPWWTPSSPPSRRPRSGRSPSPQAPTGERASDSMPEEVSGPVEPDDPGLVDRVHDEAVRAGREGRYQEAADYFEHLLRLDPESGAAHLNLGKILIQLDKPEEAIEHLQAAVAIEVPLSGAKADLIRAHFNTAAAAFNRGDMPSAIANYQRVCELDPADNEARRHLAVALARGGRIDAALLEAARLDQGVTMIPTSS